MKALISPEEFVLVPKAVSGHISFVNQPCRVAQKSEQEFEVAEPLFWVECQPNLDVSSCYYDQDAQQIVTFSLADIEDSLMPSTEIGDPQ
jgi:hypothetical protein